MQKRLEEDKDRIKKSLNLAPWNSLATGEISFNAVVGVEIEFKHGGV
jgi:hypothetical protein